MAYLVRRSSDRFEIRESRATPRGPRARTLASFDGLLTPDVLERAASRAQRPFDRAAIARKVRAAGGRVETRSREPEARALLARIRRGDRIDPVIAGILREALDAEEVAAPPEHLADVCEWVGASPERRGSALRDLLDTYGRIAASRTPPRRRPGARFPSFRSAEPPRPAATG